MTNKFLGIVFYLISVISALLMVISFGWFIVPDPLPIVVDDAAALQASGGFFMVFVATFIAGSCLRKDDVAGVFVDILSKVGINKIFAGVSNKKIEK